MGTVAIVRQILLIVALSGIGIMLLFGFLAWFLGRRREKYTGDIYVVLAHHKATRITLPMAVTFYIADRDVVLERAKRECPKGYELADVKLYQELSRFHRILVIVWYYMDGGWHIPAYLIRRLRQQKS